MTTTDARQSFLETDDREHAITMKVLRAYPGAELGLRPHPKCRTLGELSRMDWLCFLLHDEIHHRGQFSVYLRMAGARVPSIYGPTADEEWM
jgi:hypothetical protein